MELTTADGPLIFISAYVRHTSGEGLDALDAACRWAKGRCPRVILELDGNGHSSLWGPPSVRRNQVGSLLEDFIVSCDLDILNDRGGPATFVSDVGERTWIDLTLSTPCISMSIPDWRVQEDFLSGSDHWLIFFSVDSSPLRTDVFMRRAWDETPWDEFAATVRRACREEGWIEEHTRGTISITRSESIATRVARLTQSSRRQLPPTCLRRLFVGPPNLGGPQQSLPPGSICAKCCTGHNALGRPSIRSYTAAPIADSPPWSEKPKQLLGGTSVLPSTSPTCGSISLAS